MNEGIWKTDSFSFPRSSRNYPTAADLATVLKLRGYKVNRVRQTFLNGICKLKSVRNPEELWLYLKMQNNRISIAAVYCNLKVLVLEGLISRTPEADRSNSYQLNEISSPS